MGDLWRSEPMQLVQLYIQRDAAHDTIDELGEIGLMHFHDVGHTPPNNTARAPFANKAPLRTGIGRRCNKHTQTHS